MANDARRNSYMGSTSYPQYDPSIYTDPRAYHSTTPSHSQSSKSFSHSNNYDSNTPVSPLQTQATTDFHQSIPPPPPHPPPSVQPIADAVNHAFDNSSAATQLPPDMVARITEQVINSLRAELSGNANATAPPVQLYANMPGSSIPMPIPPPPPNPPSVPVAPVPPVAPFSQGQVRDISQPFVTPGSIPGSTSMAGVYGSSPVAAPTAPFTSGRTLHTPPTPERGSGVDSDHGAYFDREERRKSLRPGNESAPRDIPLRTKQAGTSSPVGGNRRENLNERYGERTREGSQPGRPPVPRNLTSDEETVLEKMWQPLFEGDKAPTSRLSQFLRGIALHLIEEFEPKQSLVIGPRKMLRYFDRMKATEESYPWNAIFGLRTDQLSKLYSTLECGHHLIARSKAPYETPNLAALTPHGFANFMTILILATPDIEFERLDATVRELPVSNADERKERWPKELSRRLFPRSSSEMAKRRFNDALSKVGIMTKPSYVAPPHPASAPLSSQPNYSSSAPSAYQGAPPMAKTSSRDQNVPPSFSHTSNSNAHRNSYAQPSSSTYNSRAFPSDVDSESTFSSDDEPERKPSLPIERERKPYTAREGGGKVYDEQNGGNNIQRSKSNAMPPSQPQVQPPPPPVQQSMPSKESTGLSKTTSRGEDLPSSSTPRNRPRTRSIAASYTSNSGKSNRGRSPSLRGTNGSFEGSQLAPSPSGYSGAPYVPGSYSGVSGVGYNADDERGYGREDAESRYAQYDQEYRNLRTGYGNTPLGPGERRYG